MGKVLIVVDMQNDFVYGTLGTEEAVEIVPAVTEKVKTAVNNNDMVIFTKDTHYSNYLDTEEGKNLPVEHCIKGSKGWEIVPGLNEYAHNIIEKNTFGSIMLPDKVREYDEIELVGLCTDICVISNALLLKAHFPEKSICVDASCCAGVTPESHNNALEAMKMCQIRINNYIQ
ncbi:MAG: cysteine hydrolase [Lachnospiraceae bacterium]|nr:cysteine hydrolase [Lachnospiraceae bacterium]